MKFDHLILYKKVSTGIIYLCLPDRKRSAIMDKDVFDIAGTGAVVIFA